MAQIVGFRIFLLLVFVAVRGSRGKGECEVSYVGNTMRMPEELCPHIDRRTIRNTAFPHSTTLHLTNSLERILPFLINDSSTVIDVMSGVGISYLAMAAVIGKTGAIVAIERSEHNFQFLQQNAKMNDAWSRTLLLQGSPSDASIKPNTATSSISLIVSELSHIGRGCPDLLRFNHHRDVKLFDTYTAILGAYSVLMKCQPILVVDLSADDLVGAVATVELLSVVQPKKSPYGIYWYSIDISLDATDTSQEVPTECESIFKSSTNALLVLPHEHPIITTLTAIGGIEPVEIQQATFDPSVNTLWESIVNKLFRTDNDVDDDSYQAQNSTILRVRTDIQVYLEDILPLDSYLYQFLGHNSVKTDMTTEKVRFVPEELSDRLLRYGLLVLTIAFDFSSAQQHFEFHNAAASAHCFNWRNRLREVLMDYSDNEKMLRQWDQELQGLQLSCTAFATKRMQTTHRLLFFRANRIEKDRMSEYFTETNRTTTTVNLSEIEESSGGHSINHAFYKVAQNSILQGTGTFSLPSTVMKLWFKRDPFEFKFDELLCAEPLWCSHTVEMQRRIRAWQFPEEVTHHAWHNTVKRVDQNATIVGADVFDWSIRPNNSYTTTCAASQFLVYEPPSDMHGIGSMMELIAAAFRYAICLDRILILNLHGQPDTLKKWIHPGCQGSMVECFFQPVSGCALTAEEISAAPLSEDGNNFNVFPLRQARILVLKGMPLMGECTLCHSGWKKGSRFFDGLFIGETVHAVDLSSSLLHSLAFQSSSKLTWASQFLRYLLRPRRWVQDTVSQLIYYSMRSPSSGVVKIRESDFSDSRKNWQRFRRTDEHNVQAFPRRFLSLHVRFGMKVAEAELQPLSKYMEFIARKLPEVTDIFVSTETNEVIQTLVAEYPEYRFHFMHYPRREYLDLKLEHTESIYHKDTDFVDEMLYSLANLYVASEAHAFVGTLSSNWCMMIMHLERTRGDGGYDYFSMDKGSAYTSCF